MGPRHFHLILDELLQLRNSKGGLETGVVAAEDARSLDCRLFRW